jgi:NADPH-dependent 2,4-dienoyl-CoA reductase/sulfur reductase-like enzyme
MRLVVIGGVAAGAKAASRAKRVRPDLEVAVYQAEPEPSISECGLPYLLSGVVAEREDLVARTPERFAEGGIEMKVRHRVEEVDPKARTLVVRDLAKGSTFEDRYDRLIFATGARAVRLPVSGADLGGVFVLRFLTDADAILRHVREGEPRKAVVIGGGYVGLEVAENLVALGMEVALIEGKGRVVPIYDPEIADRIEDHLGEKGVRVITGEAVERLVGGDGGRVRAVRLGDGREVEADLVVAGVGVRPEVALAEAAGAKTGRTGAISVNRRLETSLPDVWAAGDCAESTDLVTGEPTWTPLGDTANQMGRVAGTNAALGQGAEDALEFPGTLGTGVFKVFDLAVAKTGLSERQAEKAGFEVAAAEVESPDRASYYPGDSPIFVKLVAERGTGRLLGAEAVGAAEGGGADKQIDVCATAIWGRLTVHDLVNVDLAYAPPFGPALSPVIQAATVLSGRL